MPRLAPHMPSVPASGIRRIYELATEMDDVVMLSVGEPDLPVAPHIIRAAVEAWQRDETNYSSNRGILPLREAIRRKLARENGLDVGVDRIWATAGGTQALHLAMQLTLAPGDGVLIPDPGYTTFSMNAGILDAVAQPYPLRPQNGFLPDLAELEAIATDRTRLLIVNSPSNPLGAVFPRATLEALLDFARRRDLWVLSDEVYERLVWGEPHVSLATLDTDDRVLTVQSLSKTYAMTGIRVGWLLVPPGIDRVLSSVQEATVSCLPPPDQRAGIAALDGDQGHVDAAREHYRGNLAAARPVLDGLGLRYLDPSGAMYLWIDVSHASGGDVAGWTERFLAEQRVAVAPGSAFGTQGEGWIRVCLAATREDLLAGLSRLPAR